MTACLASAGALLALLVGAAVGRSPGFVVPVAFRWRARPSRHPNLRWWDCELECRTAECVNWSSPSGGRFDAEGKRYHKTYGSYGWRCRD